MPVLPTPPPPGAEAVEWVREHLGAAGVEAALEPAGYLGAAGALIDRALAAHREAAPA